MRPPPDKEGAAVGGDPGDYALESGRHNEYSPPSDSAAPTLEDYRRSLAERARDTGLESADRNDADWSDAVLDFIFRQASGTVLDADFVRREFGASPAVGSVFRRASSTGLIRCVGITTSTAHGTEESPEGG